MKSKSRLAMTIWDGLSVVMFLAAALLTWRITSVHGRAPLSPDRANFPESFQTVDIYYRPGSVPAGKMVGVNLEGIEGATEAGLSMSFPAKADVKILWTTLPIQPHARAPEAPTR
jgi:hypothetical protein